jgi:hypothetical protein
MPVSTRFYTISIHDLLADASVDIPAHQRPEIWDTRRKAALICTVLNGLPLGMLIFHESVEGGRRARWLEDGQQRYWSIFRYKQDAFAAGEPGMECKYSELTPDQKARFNCYQIPILTYENATPKERLYIFQYLQNGVSLTSGQRFHAMSAMSPMVRYAQQLATNERLVRVFGFGAAGLKDNKSKTQLQNAMAITGGICLGAGFITTSYDILGPELLKEVPADAGDTLDTLLSVYEAVQEISPWSNRELKKYQWPVGKITGYMLWSIIECKRLRGDMAALMQAWIMFFGYVRSDRRILNVLHKGMPSSRNWTSERWRIGFENLFIGGPEAAVLNEAALEEEVPEAINSDDESEDP